MDDAARSALYTDRSTPVVSHAERAPTRDEMSELFESVAAAAHSTRGRVQALAHVVRVLRHCPWIAGTLRIEIERSGDDTTRISLFDEHGGRREPALRAVVLDAPFDELRPLLRATQAVFAPLRVSSEDTENAIVLGAPS